MSLYKNCRKNRDVDFRRRTSYSSNLAYDSQFVSVTVCYFHDSISLSQAMEATLALLSLNLWWWLLCIFPKSFSYNPEQSLNGGRRSQSTVLGFHLSIVEAYTGAPSDTGTYELGYESILLLSSGSLPNFCLRYSGVYTRNHTRSFVDSTRESENRRT
jgi:hypothetical protein